MIGFVMVAAALAAGLAPWRVVMLAAVLLVPLPALAAVVVLAWKARHTEDNRAALFCEGVASELRAGANLRLALATTAVSLGGPVPADDIPLSDVATEMAARFAGIEEELRLTIVTAARSGSAAAAIFDELGALALAQSEIAHEVRMATAPGRATALVFIGAPLTFVLSRLSSGQAKALIASPQQRVVTLLGLGLFVVGLTIASVVAWRA